MDTIRIRGTDEEFMIREQVYPFMEIDQFTGMPTTFHRLIVVDEEDNPKQFLVVMPTDIVYKRYPYSDKDMEKIQAAADEARERHETAQQVRAETQAEMDVEKEANVGMPPIVEDYHGYL